MNIVAFDVETFAFGPGVPFPQLVCLSYDDGNDQGVMLDEEAGVWFEKKLRDKNTTLVAHNASFDCLVMAVNFPKLIVPILDAVAEGRIRCTKIREKIIANALGELKYFFDEEIGEFKGSRFDLATCVLKRFHKKIGGKKGDDAIWRKRYGLLFRVPIADWPIEAYEYSLMDSVWARKIFLDQGDIPPGEIHVTKTAIALAFFSAWGVRTNAESVEKLRGKISEEYVFWVSLAKSFDLIVYTSKKGETKPKRVNKKIRDRVEAVCKKHGIPIPVTDKNNIRADRETLTFNSSAAKDVPREAEITMPNGDKVFCVDIGLKSLSESIRTQKLLTTYVPILEQGTRAPVNTNYNEMVETFRTSASKPNLQNITRGGGVRDCYEPREGFVFVFCDFDSLEMRTLAQTCIDIPSIGFSYIGDSLRSGRDPHVDLGSEILSISYETMLAGYLDGDKEIENVRQGAKIGNYGLSGGMGVDSFVDYARGYGVFLTRIRAKVIYDSFRMRWKEMPPFFDYCRQLCGEDVARAVVHPRTGFIRGGVRYTALCNHMFQHPAAVGATEAAQNVVRETFDKSLNSPLYGSRAWLFAHDEIGLEIPYAVLGPKRSHEAAMRLQTVMIDTMKKQIPDIPVGATVCMSRQWTKGTKPVFQDGLLVPSVQRGKKWEADLDNLAGW